MMKSDPDRSSGVDPVTSYGLLMTTIDWCERPGYQRCRDGGGDDRMMKMIMKKMMIIIIIMMMMMMMMMMTVMIMH